MTVFPHSTYFWFLDQDALIMRPDLSIEEHIMGTKRLDELMLRSQPIVLPDSIIQTFPQLDGNNIDVVLGQDNAGLNTGSFILRRGNWARFFLDTWFDPLYRSYNFAKAETHALVCRLPPSRQAH
jgi:mannan polymerase II complex MNN11 subunit